MKETMLASVNDLVIYKVCRELFSTKCPMVLEIMGPRLTVDKVKPCACLVHWDNDERVPLGGKSSVFDGWVGKVGQKS